MLSDLRYLVSAKGRGYWPRGDPNDANFLQAAPLPWTVKFGAKIAANLRRRQLPPSPRWHLDEMVSTIAGERVWIWRAVDDEGEVLDMIVQKRRDTGAAVRFLRRGDVRPTLTRLR